MCLQLSFVLLLCFFFLMIRRPPRSTRTDTLFPYTTLFRSWASQPYGFVKLPDAYSTGSSIMPQKRNPDAAELVRGHAGRIIGCMTSLMVTMKGLPLAYSKDMQDDKPPVFEARSEERRVGNGCVRTGRSRWSPYH